MSSFHSNWSTEDEQSLVQFIQQKMPFSEIASKLNRKPGDIKYHSGNLAVKDFNNGVSEDDIYNKYNLTHTQLHAAIARVKREETKRITRLNSKSNNIPITTTPSSPMKKYNKKQPKLNDDFSISSDSSSNTKRKVRLIAPSNPAFNENKQDLILQYLIEIKELLTKKQQ